MSMLMFYGDDSGTDPKNRVAVVAGYVGQVMQWERFEQEWLSVLKDFQVKQMRRADLEAFGGDFKRSRGWGEERRRQFLQQLYRVLKDRTKLPIGSAVIKEDFEEIVPKDVKEMFGGVYGWCIHECIVAFRKWCDNYGYQHPIQWVFEAGTQGHGQADLMFRSLYANPDIREKWHIKGWSFRGKDVVPLQSADILAYEVYKQVENQILDKGTKREVRLSIRHLTHGTDVTYLKYWGKERLTEWLANWNSKRPPSFGLAINYTS